MLGDFKKSIIYVNPFVHSLEFKDPILIIKTCVLSIILLPIRLILMTFFLLIGWSLAYICVCGLSSEDLQVKPICGWRKKIRSVAAFAIRTVFFLGSFSYIKKKGIQATAKEAPILCLAPHSSFCDAIVILALNLPTVVARAETAETPLFGTLTNSIQPIYTQRTDRNSRRSTIEAIIQRAKSDNKWPQILIFPEGTCTNRKALITFKPGAFLSGVPVQPVCIRYPDVFDTVTWTWDNPSIIKLIWFTLTKLNTNFEIEFLPVYHPNEEEKSDALTFARNVRSVMSKSLNVPAFDYVYEDCLFMMQAKKRKIPNYVDIFQIKNLRNQLGLHNLNIEKEFSIEKLSFKSDFQVNLEDFSKQLGIAENNEIVQQLFHIINKSDKCVIDFRDYWLSALFIINQNNPLEEFLRDIVKVYSSNSQINKNIFYKVIQHSGCVNRKQSDSLFQMICQDTSKNITIDDLVAFSTQNPECKLIKFFDTESGVKKLKKL